MKNKLEHFLMYLMSVLGNNKMITATFLLSLVVFLSNSTYIAYPDEFVNILGGKAILQGKVPYKEYFDHHMPLAWYLAALFLFLSNGNFIIFRIIWAIFQFVLLFSLIFWIKKYHKNFLKYYLSFLLVIPAFNQYFWLHLFLGDSLATLFFIVALIMLFLETLQSSKSKLHFYFIPLFVTCMVFSSLSYLYIGGVMLMWTAFLYLLPVDKINLKNVKTILLTKKTALICFSFLLPYLFYGAYLLITGSVHDFIFSNFTYNTQHYISIDGFTRSARFNPIRFSATLIDNFWRMFLPAIAQLAEFSFYQPVSRLAALSLFTITLIFFRRKVVFGLLYLLTLSFSAPRSSSLLQAKETDYQIGLYLVFGLLASFFVIYALVQHHSIVNNVYKKFINTVLYFWIGAYLVLTSVFILFNSYHVWYSKYMGTLSPIVNYSYVGEYIDSIIDARDTYWLGPFHAQDHYFVKKGKFAGKYPSLLPQFSESEYLKKDFLNEMEKNKPVLVIFRHATWIFGTPAPKFGAFFLEWMNGKYVSCKELKIQCKQNLRDFDVMGDVYIRKDRMDILEKIK